MNLIIRGIIQVQEITLLIWRVARGILRSPFCMRALGADPIKKLVTPRIVALVTMAPALTVICNMIGTMGGMLAAISFQGQASSVYISSAKEAVTYNEILGGLIKPTVFGFIIAI